MFHRVVPGFIIQGGNSDSRKSMSKRQEIGRYLLPPDTKKGYSHHRGVISMPSSEIDNPYKLASPYEFFIVQQSPGAYHLDGNYTAFGKVIEGMNVVDKISEIEVDKRLKGDDFITTIFHEMVHVKQYVRKELFSECNFYADRDEYLKLPWEIEAYKLQEVLLTKWNRHKKTS